MEMSPIPKTAPFAEEEIDLLNRVVGTASPIQRAWLAGFLAGLDASSGGGAWRRHVKSGVLLLGAGYLSGWPASASYSQP